jgi:ABC-type glycerol-3-phosphate transport system permease component
VSVSAAARATPSRDRAEAVGRRRRRLRTLGLYAILIIGGLIMLVPFFWMVATSLKTRAEVFSAPMLSFPSGFHLENYGRMWNALPGVTFGDFFLNSLKIATLATVGSLVSCSMAAFAFAVLVPNFILYRYLPHPLSDSGNWIGTQEPLWVGAWLGGAFGIFLIRQFFLTVPRELADAARVDGASPWGIFRWIYIPLARPVLATLAIFTFMWSWNDLLSPLIYLRDLPDYTTTVGLAFFQGQHVGKWPEMMAGAMVSLVPMVALFVIAQQYFVRGIAISGLKG